MLYFHLVVYLLFSVIQLLSGILANGVIVVGSSMDLIRRRTRTSLDLLLCCLGVSRICMQLAYFYVTLSFLSLVEFRLSSGFLSVNILTSQSGLWFATWLGVFYCAKIAKIAHPLFSWLKRRISKLVPWLILASLLYASVVSAVSNKYAWPIFKKLVIHHLFKNVTAHNKEDFPFMSTCFILGLSLPLLIFLASVLLLVFSLGRHTMQMRRTTVSAGDLSRSSVLSALLSILSFLFLYLCYYLAGTLLVFLAVRPESFPFWICISLCGTYPSAHSVILIWGNHKLKQNAKMLLLHSRCWR